MAKPASSRSARIAGLASDPLAWILLAVLVVHAVGIGWGLPATDGWDSDGVAPRDFLPGLYRTFTPGSFNTYPPVHLVVLAVLTLPITLAGYLRAPAHDLPSLVGELVQVPYMTSIAYVARSASLVMSVAIVYFLARTAEEIATALPGSTPSASRRAGWCTAAFAGVNATLAYYAKTTNLDVPYLFWATWSLLVFVRAIVRAEPRLLRRAFVLAALAIGTKDQAYALFALSIPIALGGWAFAESSLSRRGAILREAAIGAAVALVVLLVVDNALLNPSGFAGRLAFLRGSASQDYVEYTNDWPGRWGLLADAYHRFPRQMPKPLGAFALAAAGWALARARRSRGPAVVAVAVPLLVLVSFTVAFNFVARRADARFLLPQALMLAPYGGLALAPLVFAAGRTRRLVAQAVASAGLAGGLFTCIAVAANLHHDPRYDAEAWLRAHVAPGDTVEVYGKNVYLPRFTEVPDARVQRVGPEPVAGRNPLPGVTEIEAPFEDAPARAPRFIVVPYAWVWRYLIRPDDFYLGAGRQHAPTQERDAAQGGAVGWFRQLRDDKGPYRVAHVSDYDGSIFPIVHVHGTTGLPVWIYELRTPTSAGE
ncbi:MAG: hypothetical protein KIT84_05755 [Labilithrix sp.]|nr:hypothetical protein [Labilithrix sp.]MCW5810494.1 hypothetical protein [Labilithrix sp.]